jgi:hypothetical protein
MRRKNQKDLSQTTICITDFCHTFLFLIFFADEVYHVSYQASELHQKRGRAMMLDAVR